MRVVGVLALIVGLLGMLGGLGYAGRSTIVGWTRLAEHRLVPAGRSTGSYDVKAGRYYYAMLHMEGPTHRQAVTSKSGEELEVLDYDIPLTVRIEDSAGNVARALDLHVDGNKPLPTCFPSFDANQDPCTVILLKGRERDRIGIDVRVPSMTTTASGAQTFAIDLGHDSRGGVVVESAKLVVYRDSNEEVLGGLVGAIVSVLFGVGAFAFSRSSRFCA